MQFIYPLDKYRLLHIQTLLQVIKSSTFDNTYSGSEKISHKYFNITENQISKNHDWDKVRFSKFLKALEESK